MLKPLAGARGSVSAARLCSRFYWPRFWLLSLAFALHGVAQETRQGEAAASASDLQWKIINTAIFAIGLGWALWKFAPAFFNARSADIQKAIKDATGLKIEADFRYSEIDRRMARLGEEVKALRQQAAEEREREHQRLRADIQTEIEHIHRNVTAEIDAFRQEGAQQIRVHAAQLALQSAERRLRERFSRQNAPDDFVQDFIHLVERGKN